ncbi:hypothetical protein [Caminibacter pacificus]|uniref:Uncharacterized protein n=1 Tax=Caminibacter pacificus TaxID=1424653 RepID=A0AAJ4RB15_9BACT|nr:hypothetical protein [Caminibacter pacificus]QDD68147.1 hypothetical protein C6V80_09850 [Caminibacter pacificus]ROR38765.1 hypothetical protein EDC58_1980 [Caminibacter pacificus]
MILVLTLNSNNKNVLNGSFLRIGIDFLVTNKSKLSKDLNKYIKDKKDEFLILNKYISEGLYAKDEIKLQVSYYLKNPLNGELTYINFLYPVKDIFNKKKLNEFINNVKELDSRVKDENIKLPKLDEVKELFKEELKVFKDVKR